MIEVKLSVYQKGNYGCELTARHDFTFKVISGTTEDDRVYGLLSTTMASLELEKLKDEFFSFSYIKEFQVLEGGMAKVVFLKSEGDFPLSASVYRFGGFYLYPITFSKGREKCTIIFESREAFRKFLDIITLDIRIVGIRDVGLKEHLPEDLTEKQLEALNLALKEGYFNTPKGIDLSELSARMKVSKATFLEHLKKAERKILEKYMQP